MIFTQVSFTWNILWFPVVLLEVYIFSLGVSLILASTAIFFRDIQYLWGVFISIWMYLTPIIYPVSIISEEYRWWYDNLNPMYGYLKQFRDIVLNGNPLPIEWLTQGFITAFIFLFIGLWVFKRKQNQFILYI